MKIILLITTLLGLASCGVDGAPTAPVKSQTAPGVSITGEARMGVVGTL